MNNLSLAGALVTAPSSAFAELRERPRFWFPLLLVIFATGASWYWYYSVVDIEWLKDAMFTNNPDIQKLPEDQRAAAMSMANRTTMLWSAVIATCVFIPIFLVLETFYLLLVSQVAKLPQGFKQWFALASWSMLPTLLNVVVTAILLTLSDTSQIGTGVMQPLSLNELVFHHPMGSPGQALLESVGIPFFLSCALMIIGIRTWTQRSWVFSATVALLPWVIIYGTWAFFAFR